MTTRTRGGDVKAGQTLWFLGNPHRITRIEPYVGSLAPLWDGKARIAYDDNDRRGGGAWGITLEPQCDYDISD